MELTVAQLHLMWNGQSHDISLSDLDVVDESTDSQIKSSLAEHMSVPVSKFDNFSIDRNTETGDITVRPGAIFG